MGSKNAVLLRTSLTPPDPAHDLIPVEHLDAALHHGIGWLA